MDANLQRAYLATIYEFSMATGTLRASLDGDVPLEPAATPELLARNFALITAYNPRSMLLPRRVNEARHGVLRDLLILGCYRVEPCLGHEEDPDGIWREPAWVVHGIDRDEACQFGRVFRQNAIVYSREGRPEIIVTDPTCDDPGKAFSGHWRIR